MSVNYRAVAFSRPGESGLIPYIGALWAAENANALSQISAWISPSTTSFISLLIISGYKCIEIMAILIAIPELLSAPIPFKNPISIGNTIDDLKRKFNEILIKKYNTIPTLKQLQDNYEIIIVGVGFTLEKQEIEYIHASTYPNMNILDFLCISFSTPGIYKPYKFGDNYWVDGSIIDSYPIGSIDLESGKILGISTAQSAISMRANDPLSQIKNIMRSLFEASRFSNITTYSNLTNIIIPIDDITVYESSTRNHPFPSALNQQLGNEVTGKLKCGWEAFTKKHSTSPDIQENEDDEAQKQE